MLPLRQFFTFSWAKKNITVSIQKSCITHGYETINFYWLVERELIKFIYFEKATKFCEISTVDLSYVVTVKFTVKILQSFVAFSEYINFNSQFWIFPIFQPIILFWKNNKLGNIQFDFMTFFWFVLPNLLPTRYLQFPLR